MHRTYNVLGGEKKIYKEILCNMKMLKNFPQTALPFT